MIKERFMRRRLERRHGRGLDGKIAHINHLPPVARKLIEEGKAAATAA